MKKKLLTAAIASALVAPMSASALEHSVSGQVSRMIRFADDGKASEVQQLDASGLSSRIRWRGTGDIGRGMKAGFLVEAANFSSGSSSAGIKADDGDPGNDSEFSMRHSRIDFSGRWGRVQLGQTSPAGDGFADQDLTGVAHDGYDIFGDNAGGIEWRTKGGGDAGTAVGDTKGTLDGGRKDVLRYDSPALGPVTIATSVSNDNYWDIAAYVDTALGGGQLQFSGGYIKAKQRSDYNAWGLSASYQFSQGTSLSGTYSTRDNKAAGGGDDPSNWAIRVGHKWGNNAVALGYGEGKDQDDSGSKHQGFSVAFSHTLPKPGIDLFAGYNYNSLDLGGTYRTANGLGKAEDVNVFYVGSRIQFN